MHKIVNGKQVELTEEETLELKEHQDRCIEKSRSREYALKRQLEYPSIPEQLDMIYHQGVDVWKASIKAVKDKYPKPTE